MSRAIVGSFFPRLFSPVRRRPHFGGVEQFGQNNGGRVNVALPDQLRDPIRVCGNSPRRTSLRTVELESCIYVAVWSIERSAGNCSLFFFTRRFSEMCGHG